MKKWQRNTTLFIITVITIGIISSSISQSFAQVSHTEPDVTPVAALIMMTKDKQGKVVFEPKHTKIKEGQEIMIANNLTSIQTFTNGKGLGDPLDGKKFSIVIKPNNFAEYLVSNIPPGEYPFYSKNNPSMTGLLTVLPP